MLARRKFTFAMPFPNFFPDTITEDDANFPISPTNGCMRNYCPKFTRFDPLPSVSFFLPFMRMYLLPVLYTVPCIRVQKLLATGKARGYNFEYS